MVNAKAAPAPAVAKKDRVFRITDIPDVMQNKLGWLTAARLMRRWFNSPARIISEKEKTGRVDPRVSSPAVIDETIVSMRWAMNFARVSLARDKLLAGWATPLGLVQLRARVNAARPAALPKGKTSWRFGDLSKPAKVLDKTCQINFSEVGTLSDPLDDFYGAIGKGVLKLAVSGLVSHQANGRDRITIDEVGIYLRDTYDFNDDSFFSQPLGYWGSRGVQRGLQLRWDIEIDVVYAEPGKVPPDRYYAVQNDDFQSYRAKYGRGGDFVIYSDVVRMRLAKPLEAEV